MKAQFPRDKEGKPGALITLHTTWDRDRYLGIQIPDLKVEVIARAVAFVTTSIPEPSSLCVTEGSEMRVRICWGQMVDLNHLAKISYSDRKTQHRPRSVGIGVRVSQEKVVVEVDGVNWLFWRMTPEHPEGIPAPELAQVKDPRDVIVDCCRFVMLRHSLSRP
jgi:hypothetical protein